MSASETASKPSLRERLRYQTVTVDLSPNHDGSMMRSIQKPRHLGRYLAAIIVIAILVLCFCSINYSTFQGFKWDQLGAIFHDMFNPLPHSLKTWDAYWSYMWGEAIRAIWTTNEMCFIGVILGAVISIPIYYLCASNINHNRILRGIFRVINDVLRTIPQMVMALILRLFFGPTLVTGIASIIIFTLGIMYQLMYQYIETLELSPFEAIRSNGGNTMQCIRLSVHPEVQPMFFANLLYTFEINIRASVILGYVGAGGYGFLLKTNFGSGYYDKIGAMMIPLFIEVVILQIISNAMGRKSR